MQILINIPLGLKMVFEHENWTALDCMEMKKALMNGVVLPKGHGRILDEKEILDTNKNDGILYDLVDMPEYIGKVPAIIEAESEDRK